MQFLLKILFFLLPITSLFSANISLGIDVLVENHFAPLQKKKIGLLTNQSGRDSKGTLTAEILTKTDKLSLKYIFVPEHGLWGNLPAGQKVSDASFNGIPVISLYGEKRTPNLKYIKEVDALVVDIQDIGIRSYTYISTVFYFIKAAAEAHKPVYVLDRPNPINGVTIDGNVLEDDKTSFVGIMPIPYIHGMTIGEIAKMIVGEGWLGSDKKGKKLKTQVEVIEMKGWKREMCFEDTGLMWFPTSPHIPAIDAIRGAALVGIFGELGILNIGIGTTLPFQYIGSPNFKTDEVLNELNKHSFEGVSFFKAQFRPFYGKFKEQTCEGILFKFTCNENFYPMKFGAILISAIKSVHPELFNKSDIPNKTKEMFIKVTGTEDYFNSLFSPNDFSYIRLCSRGIEQFNKIRNKYLLY
ncbi:MAG: DUF1343 domain-containing protein [Bacteroidota bacterium]